MSGGIDNDAIYGGNGADQMNGDAGNDALSGGAGADAFFFDAGRDTVADFADNLDTIFVEDTLLGAAPKTVASILAEGSIVAGNAVFDFGGGHVLTVLGVSTLGTLSDDLALF